MDGRAAVGANVQLRRDFLDVSLDEGDFYRLEACGRLVGLLWVGLGSLDVRDPGPLRSHALHNEFENLPGRVEIEAALFIASDGAVGELEAQLPGGARAWQDRAVPPRVYALAESRLGGFDPNRQSGLSAHPPGEILWAPTPALGGAWAEFQAAGLKRRRSKQNLEIVSRWLTWSFTSGAGWQAPESGVWERRATGSTLGRTLATFPSEGDLADSGTPFGLAPPRRAFDLVAASVSAVFEPVPLADRDIKAVNLAATLELRSEAGGAALGLALAEGRRKTYGERWQALDVRGVQAALGEGALVDVDWSRAGDRLWVPLPAAASAGQTVRVLVRYGGKLVDPDGQFAITPLAGWRWYPQGTARDVHEFEAQVAVPRAWNVAATGRQLEEFEDGSLRTLFFRESAPVRAGAVFVQDGPVALTRGEGGLPVLRVHRSPSTVRLHAAVEDEVQQHLAALSAVLGPFPFAELHIVERRTAGSWSSVPGVIVLPRFDSPPNQVVTSRLDSTTTLLEALARQWIGAWRGGRSAHDSWLVASMASQAECQALIASDKQARCQGELSRLRNEWIRQLESSQQQWVVGPIWQNETSGWGSSNSTLRGPLVLAGLRTLAGHAAIASASRDELAEADEGIDTLRWLGRVQAAAGEDLRPFFYGWLMATPQDPRIEATWESTQAPDGTWTLDVDYVLESGQDTEVPLLWPLTVAWSVGDDTSGRVVLADGQSRSLQVTGLPARPSRVVADAPRLFPGRVTTRSR